MYLNPHRIFSECSGEFLDLQTQNSTEVLEHMCNDSDSREMYFNF